MRFGQALQLVLVPAHQNRVRQNKVPVGQGDSALGAYGQDRPYQVLIGAHAPGYPVHDYPDLVLFHRFSFPWMSNGLAWRKDAGQEARR
jgi:hypothetical protein